MSQLSTAEELILGVVGSLNAGTSLDDVRKRIELNHPTHEADQIIAGAEERIAHARDLTQRAQDAQTFEKSTDLGNGNRFVARHAEEVRYIAESKSWLAWDGRLWVPGALGAVERHAKATALSIYGDVQRAGKVDGNLATELTKWAKASSCASRIDAMIKISRSDLRVEASWEDFDSELLALNVGNGIVDLRTGKLRPHDPAEMHSKIAAASLTQEAARSWESFLAEIMPDDDVRHYIHKLAGYSCSGEIGEHVFPFAHGGGGNGKGVFFSVLRKVLGDYATEAAPDLLVAKHERGIPVDVMDLRGFRFVTTSELEGGKRMATELLKHLTGDDELKARKLYGNFQSFRNVSHLWMAANEKPQLDGLDKAIWRRLRLLPFTVTIPDAEQDPDLIGKLMQERDGILGWLIDGYQLYQEEGLLPPAGVEAATDDYRSESNPLLAWFDSEDGCTLEPDEITTSDALHGSYAAWCAEDRYRGKPLSKSSSKFSAGVEALGGKRDRLSVDGSKVRVFRGLRLNVCEPSGTCLA